MFFRVYFRFYCRLSFDFTFRFSVAFSFAFTFALLSLYFRFYFRVSFAFAFVFAVAFLSLYFRWAPEASEAGLLRLLRPWGTGLLRLGETAGGSRGNLSGHIRLPLIKILSKNPLGKPS